MPHDFSPDLSVIIVSWNVRDLLRRCLDSLRNSPGIVWGDPRRVADLANGKSALPDSSLVGEVIVVDNASADGSAAMLAEAFPWVRLVASRQNLGFTGGNNRAIPLARGRFVLFLNPDTEVIGDALVEMIQCMEGHSEIAVLGPELRYAVGALQSSRRRFPTLMMALCESTPLAWHWPDNPWARRYHMDDLPAPASGVQRVDWVVGAAFLVRSETLDQIGGFDEGYFMYSEELDWCRRAANEGWQVAFLGSAEITHHEGRSSEQLGGAREVRFQTSKVRYFRKFHGALAAETLRVATLFMFSVEYVLEGVKRLLGSRREMRSQRMAAYRVLLKSGLRDEQSA